MSLSDLIGEYNRQSKRQTFEVRLLSRSFM